ncbi:MAG TPA: amino acid permease [Steroidobacteraceae bacterium]|nr:amino acid permease [Steroidobacteraceae bacterium]
MSTAPAPSPEPGAYPQASTPGAAPQLRRTLQRRHMEMIALGGVIGAGLFVGSGVVVQQAGPAAVLSFALTGTLVVLVMRMLAEMAVAYPAIGGFYEYNRLALGELAGFMTGWMYWYFWVIVVALEAVAGARLLMFWYPQAAPWVLTLALMLLFTVLNLLSVRSWGESEFWFASIKVAAIVLFLSVGVLVLLHAWPGVPGGLHNLSAHGGFAPRGLGPVLAGAVAATGFYFGAELVTVAAAESAAPEQAVARATQSVIWRVLIFYVGSVLIVVAILPWNSPAMAQPYVNALQALHVPAAAQLMNAVVLTAVLSALNSGLFASSRMLLALAMRGDAPRSLSRLNARGVPSRAILTGTLFGYVAVLMNYLSPERVFAFLVNSYGTVAIFVYVLIALAELRLRAQLERTAPERLRVRMWGYPYLTLLVIAAMCAIVAAMAFIAEQRAPLLFGLLSAAAMLLGYLARRRLGAPA